MVTPALIPALGKLREEDHEFEVSLTYKARLCLKNKKNKTEQK
jgi:hypothetical protein